MRKHFLIAALICWVLAFGTVVASAETPANWHTANQSTVAWDAVTTNLNGDPLPADNVVKYDVFIANAITDAGKVNPAQVVQDITDLLHTFTLNVEGRYFVGVKAKRYVDVELVSESSIAWSDNSLYVAEGQTFGLQYFLPPAEPILRKSAQ